MAAIPQYSIDDAKKLFSDRSGTVGISGNVAPDKFNRWWNSAEMKFFNERFLEYAKSQVVSDTISKWLSDDTYLTIPTNGFYTFPQGLNLIHVASLSNYYQNLNPINTLGSLVGGSGYTSGTYANVNLTGGTGTGAVATITVNQSGIVTYVTLTSLGSGYIVGDVLSANLFGGIGFTINVLSISGTMIATTTNLVGGSGYTSGIYKSVPLTGGTGTGAAAFIVVVNGSVVTCLINNQGTGYAVGNILSATAANIGGTGTGFTITVSGVTSASLDDSITRVEKELLASNLQSIYEYPTQQFAIYTQYSNGFRFWPNNIGFVKLIYLQQPIWSVWGYNLQGYISTVTGLVGGTGYTSGTYNNVPLTGGLGNSALATIVVSGGAVTSVTITNQGKLYAIGDTLSATASNIGGTGSGFSITVSSLVSGSIRPIYNAATSVQPLWNNSDINTIVDIALKDAAISNRDKELTKFADDSTKALQ